MRHTSIGSDHVELDQRNFENKNILSLASQLYKKGLKMKVCLVLHWRLHSLVKPRELLSSL